MEPPLAHPDNALLVPHRMIPPMARGPVLGPPQLKLHENLESLPLLVALSLKERPNGPSACVLANFGTLKSPFPACEQNKYARHDRSETVARNSSPAIYLNAMLSKILIDDSIHNCLKYHVYKYHYILIINYLNNY